MCPLKSARALTEHMVPIHIGSPELDCPTIHLHVKQLHICSPLKITVLLNSALSRSARMFTPPESVVRPILFGRSSLRLDGRSFLATSDLRREPGPLQESIFFMPAITYLPLRPAAGLLVADLNGKLFRRRKGQVCEQFIYANVGFKRDNLHEARKELERGSPVNRSSSEGLPKCLFVRSREGTTVDIAHFK